MDIRQIYTYANKIQAIHDKNMEIVANFEEQWAENEYVLLDDLLCALAKGNQYTKESYIRIVLASIKENSLIVWHGDKSYTLNAFITLNNYEVIPKNTLVLKKDILEWQQKSKSIPILPFMNLSVNSNITIEKIIDENEALKAKVAELEQRLSEYKELPTQTKNMVMPVIYGLCCLYSNRGNPLSKSRASCGVIAKELTAKFGAKITDETLERYYKQGRDILGKEK